MICLPLRRLLLRLPQVLLLLKSSDRVMHDVCDAFASCPAQPAAWRLQLALQRWVPLRPDGELRCFVHQRRLAGVHRLQPCSLLSGAVHHLQRPSALDGRLQWPLAGSWVPGLEGVLDLHCLWGADVARILAAQAQSASCGPLRSAEQHCAAAVCQRRLEQAYPGLAQQREQLLDKLRAWHQEHVAQQFPLADYVMDLYLTSTGKVGSLAGPHLPGSPWSWPCASWCCCCSLRLCKLWGCVMSAGTQSWQPVSGPMSAGPERDCQGTACCAAPAQG